MTKQEMYYAIVKRLYWQYPAVVGGLRDLIAQGRLSPEKFIDYLHFWARVYREFTKGKRVQDSPHMLIVEVNILIHELIHKDVFTEDAWSECRRQMVKDYMEMELAEKREQKRRELYPEAYAPDKMPPSFVEEYIKDGHPLAPEEIAFENWLVAHFDDAAWCRRARIVYDAGFAARLEALYVRIGVTRRGI